MPVTTNDGIKSIQRGTITIASGQVSGTATIAAVDVAKTVVNFQGLKSSETNYSSGLARLWLTNSTSIGAVRSPTTSYPSQVFVNFEVVEFW